ncbi:MAG: DUF1232 domain-containing protein [Chloroflexi bacterium]|nr:DUF1232 domain-containing protein [Chloroflexota bacterium]
MLRILYALPLLWRGLKLAWRLFRDRRVPLYLKALPVLGLIYAISPWDVVPDILPVVGQIDDLVVAVLLLLAFVLLALRAIAVDTGRRTGRDSAGPRGSEPPTIEGRYRRVERGE